MVAVNCTQLDFNFTNRYAFKGQLTKGGKANHDRNATKKPSHEKKKTLPYRLIGLKIGIDSALNVRGLTSGALYVLVSML